MSENLQINLCVTSLLEPKSLLPKHFQSDLDMTTVCAGNELYRRTALSGFTYGFGLRIKMFTLSYARATYMAGSFNPNYFSLAMNLGQFTNKKQ